MLGVQGRLGWTTWVPPDVMLNDPDDLVLGPMERVFQRQSDPDYDVVTIEPTMFTS
jgi:hypothetical protein